MQWYCNRTPRVRRSVAAAGGPAREHLPVADQGRPGQTRSAQGARVLRAAPCRAPSPFHFPQADSNTVLPTSNSHTEKKNVVNNAAIVKSFVTNCSNI